MGPPDNPYDYIIACRFYFHVESICGLPFRQTRKLHYAICLQLSRPGALASIMTKINSLKKSSSWSKMILVVFVIFLVIGFLFLGRFFGRSTTFGLSQGRFIENMLLSILAIGMLCGLAISYAVMIKSKKRSESSGINPYILFILGLILIVVSFSFFTFTSAPSDIGEPEYYIVLPIKAYSILVSTIGCIFIGGAVPFLDLLRPL